MHFSRMRDRPILFHSLTPLQILLGSTLLAASLVTAGVLILTNQPWLGMQLHNKMGEPGLVVAAVHPDSPSHGRLYPSYELSHIRVGDVAVPLDEESLHSAPHFVSPDYSSLQHYFEHQQLLEMAFSAERVGVLDQEQRLYWMAPMETRPAQSLPTAFWLYNAFGVIAFMLGVGIWSHSRGRLPARLTAVTGLVFLIFATSSAVLEGRGLLLPVETLKDLLSVQRGSMYLFLSLLMTAILVTPRGLHYRGLAVAVFAGMGLLWANEQWQLIQWPWHTHLFPLMLVVPMTLFLARRQWCFSRDWPEQHAAFKWLLLSLMIAAGLGMAIQLLPTIYYQTPANGLGVWTGIFFFIYLGLLMGHYGERRFNIERWWLETLAWFTGGLFVIGLDAALVFLMQLSPDKALGVAVLAIGWAYLPARHWFWKRVVRGEKQELEESLPLVLETLLAEDKRADLSVQWRELLQRLFEPMQLTIIEKPLHHVSLKQSGLAMHVPSVHGDRTLELSWRKRGARLFSLADARLAESILQLFRNRDVVTGLPNRNVLLDRVRQYQVDSRMRSWSLIFVRLKRFKAIMNLLGSEAGEDVLRQVPKRLRRAVKRTNVHVANAIAYLGNGEFVVFLPGYSSDQLLPVIQALSDELRTPMQTGEHSVDLSTHMGIASYPEHGGEAETLLQNAETAMHVAKEGKSEYAIYSAEFEEKSMRKMALTNSLRRAIGKELLLHYQPKLDLRSNTIVSVEALMRWRHTHYGVVSPTEFIPLAEQNNLIRPITYWALDYALEQVADWHYRGQNLGMAVNISVQCLQDSSFVDRVLSSIHQYGVRPGALTLEITESEFMTDTSNAMETLTLLSDEGVRLSIDDFGTGYSSLAYLKSMPVDELKIDQSFIKNMTEDADNASIVKAIIELAHTLDLLVVSEGVEDQQTLQMLTSLGTDQVQGFYVHRPIAVTELNRWLKEWEQQARQLM
ncbi:MAG: EAL domain-containing protein [Gammaproteobacteria bacterium]|nr:EAL domain-containing protein [Gammaproteobacteria bacterium]